MSKKKRKSNLADEAMDLVAGGAVMGTGALALTALPAGAGAAGLAGLGGMGGMMPVLGTAKGGGLALGELTKLSKKLEE